MRTFFPAGLFLLGLVLMNLAVENRRPGGSRSPSQWQQVASDWFWIRGYAAWMDKSEVRLLDAYGFATALNPQRMSYWRLAAQTIAFDLPVWTLRAVSPDGSYSASLERQVRHEYGLRAVRFFERSRPYFAEDPTWFVTAGFLAETAVGDRGQAIGYYAQALEKKDPPFLAGRMYARLLVEDGQRAGALAFLKAWYATLPEDQIEARKSDVHDWIVLLEKEVHRPSDSN